MALELTRAQVLGSRVRAQQLNRTAGTLADTAVLDLGVQDTGADAGRWALAVRGVDDVDTADLALVWTLRGAPHLYRRADLPGVAAATAPFTEADACKRVFDAAKPLKDAGIPVLTALDTIAAQLRSGVTAATVKGEMSGSSPTGWMRRTCGTAGRATPSTRSSSRSDWPPCGPAWSCSRTPRPGSCGRCPASRRPRRCPNPWTWCAGTCGCTVRRRRFRSPGTWTRRCATSGPGGRTTRSR